MDQDDDDDIGVVEHLWLSLNFAYEASSRKSFKAMEERDRLLLAGITVGLLTAISMLEGKSINEIDNEIDRTGWEEALHENDFGALGDRLNFLELDLTEALGKESDDEKTIELLSAAIEKVRGALADIRNIGQME